MFMAREQFDFLYSLSAFYVIFVPREFPFPFPFRKSSRFKDSSLLARYQVYLSLVSSFQFFVNLLLHLHPLLLQISPDFSMTNIKFLSFTPSITFTKHQTKEDFKRLLKLFLLNRYPLFPNPFNFFPTSNSL